MYGKNSQAACQRLWKQLRDGANPGTILLEQTSILVRTEETRFRISVVAGFIPASFGGGDAGGCKTCPYEHDTNTAHLSNLDEDYLKGAWLSVHRETAKGFASILDAIMR